MMPPDERAFRAYLETPACRVGEARGRWRLIGIEWPHAWFAVSAAERANSPDEYVLRFELHGYPHATPTATPWDVEVSDLLAPNKRPQGEHVGKVFRHDWEGGRALYAPYDRVAIDSHANWKQEHPNYLWDPDIGLVQVLRHIHDLLNGDDYLGIQAA